MCIRDSPSIDVSKPIAVTTSDIVKNGKTISQRLDAAYPLQSYVWRELASTLWRNEESFSSLTFLDAIDVSEDFDRDSTSYPYGYKTSTPFTFSFSYEDPAVLFEHLMMKHFFNLDKTTLFRDATEQSNCYGKSMYHVEGRIGNPRVLERAMFVLNLALPEHGLNLDIPRPIILVPECTETIL